MVETSECLASAASDLLVRSQHTRAAARRALTLPVSLMLETFGYGENARLTIADTICHMSPPDLTDLELETAARACRVLAHHERKVPSNQRSCFARAW